MMKVRRKKISEVSPEDAENKEKTSRRSSLVFDDSQMLLPRNGETWIESTDDKICNIIPWSYLGYVPMLNIVTTILLGPLPTPSSIKELLNLLGLVSALLLTVSATLPFAFDVETYHSLMLRATALNRTWSGREPESLENYFNKFWIYNTDALMMETFTLFTVFLVLVVTTTTSFKGPDGNLDARLLRHWWQPMRIVVFGTCVSLVVGVTEFFAAIGYLMMFTVPCDYESAWSPNGASATFFWWDSRDIKSSFDGKSYRIVIWPLSISLVIISYALARRTALALKLGKEYRAAVVLPLSDNDSVSCESDSRVEKLMEIIVQNQESIKTLTAKLLEGQH
jgi:hypothetical protein